MQKARGNKEAADTVPGTTFTFQGTTIQVDSQSPDDLEWLQEFLQPWFETSNGAPDWRVQFHVDAERYRHLYSAGPASGSARVFMMDTRVIEYPRWHCVDGGCLLFDEQRNLFFHILDEQVDIVAPRADYKSRMRLMRVVRELAMGAAQAVGDRFLHASAVALDGRAIVMTGRRSAGKTSLLLYLLSQLDARFLGNDRLLLRAQQDMHSVLGMPTAVSVRAGTLALFPGFHERIRQRGFTTRLTLRECQTVDEVLLQDRQGDKWGLSPAQFCAATSVEPVREVRGGVILLPQQTGCSGGLQLREVDGAQAAIALAEGLFGHIGPGCLSEVFTPRGPRVTPIPDKAFLAGLASSFTVYECLLGTDVYNSPDGARKIERLLRA